MTWKLKSRDFVKTLERVALRPALRQNTLKAERTPVTTLTLRRKTNHVGTD